MGPPRRQVDWRIRRLLSGGLTRGVYYRRRTRTDQERTTPSLREFRCRLAGATCSQSRFPTSSAILQASFSRAALSSGSDGQDTRAIQLYLGHKNINHTVRYTELSRHVSKPSGETNTNTEGPLVESVGDNRLPSMSPSTTSLGSAHRRGCPGIGSVARGHSHSARIVRKIASAPHAIRQPRGGRN